MITLTTSQQAVLDKVKAFVEDETKNIFILKGYAGTGKTTLVQFIVEHLESIKLDYELMAPTGRAAKVLRSKLKRDATTIHAGIYSFKLKCKETEEVDKSKKSYSFFFPLKDLVGSKKVTIVDESSMISDTKEEGEFLTFGSGQLLSDLLTYVNHTVNKKLILVGDYAQLPPVTDSHSMAFDVNYLQSKGFVVEETEMTEVIRQAEDSNVLKIASNIRTLLKTERNQRSEFIIEHNGNDVISVDPEDVSKTYTETFPTPNLENGVIICYSNRQCLQYNHLVRNRYYPGKKDLAEGDRLLINSNNYTTFGFPFFNGDMVTVLKVGEVETHKNIPVSIKDQRRHIDLRFLNVELMTAECQIPIPCKILLNLLESEDRDLSVWETRALYIDFCMRSGLKDGTEEFVFRLAHDPYFNALKVKYGYAITCHKSQGGEWNQVFVDYTRRSGLDDHALRWCYTATTRARQTLYVINEPNITCFTKLRVMADIVKIAKTPKGFWDNLPEVGTPFHTQAVPNPVKCKYQGICEALKNTPYDIESVTALAYRDRYTFIYNETQRITIDVLYDKGGTYNRLPVTGDNSPADFLRNTINNSSRLPSNINYKPSEKALENLWQVMSSLCDLCGIQIVNVSEDLPKYMIIYHLLTEARFATMVFYYSNGMLTYAQGNSELGNEDVKLKQLIAMMC